MKTLVSMVLVLLVSSTILFAAPAASEKFYSPQLSPEGTLCIWESMEKSASIWISDISGENMKFVTTGHSPSWNEDGTFNFVKSEDDGHVILWQNLYNFDLHHRTTSLIAENSDNPDYTSTIMNIAMNATSQGPLSGKIIAVDPGHGSNSGAYSKHSEKFEDFYVLQSANVVKKYLEASGATVKLTRTDNSVCPALSARVNFSNSIGASAFVSIHYNSAVSESAKGLEVFYRSYNSGSKAYGKAIHGKMLPVSGMNDRRLKGDKEILGFYLGVLSSSHNTDRKSLTEGGFLSNKDDAALIDNLQWNTKLSWGIYCGICESLGVEPLPFEE